MLLATLLLGCALSAHRSGLVGVEGERVTLTEPTGRAFVISPRGEGAVLQRLERCTVAVDGPRLGGRLWVRDWDVLDAGDGAPPYVGLLRRHGGNWVIDDRHSGRAVILEPRTVGDLAQEEGRLVLVRGLVVGAQTVSVVAWRALEPR